MSKFEIGQRVKLEALPSMVGTVVGVELHVIRGVGCIDDFEYLPVISWDRKPETPIKCRLIGLSAA